MTVRDMLQLQLQATCKSLGPVEVGRSRPDSDLRLLRLRLLLLRSLPE